MATTKLRELYGLTNLGFISGAKETLCDGSDS